MSTPVRLGLAGPCDAFPSDREELAKDAAYRVTAVWDADPAKAKTAVQAFGDAAACASYGDLLENVDAVWVAGPVQERAELVCTALRAGKHVLCEGCGGRTPEEVEQMLAAANASGRTLAFQASRLRNAGYTPFARSYVTPEKTGRIYRVEAVLHRPAGHASAGGVLATSGIYLLDQALSLIGWPELQALTAQTVPHGSAGEHTTVYARLAGGLAFSLDVAASQRLRPKHTLTILGDRGGLVIDHTDGGRGFSFIEDAPGLRAKLVESKPLFRFDAWGTDFRNFREQIAEGKPAASTTGVQARELARWLQCARASAESAREVRAAQVLATA